ncbi:squalene--hopene cyclase [Actinoplanes sp. NPDC049265]|uniref:squalene--hopene cyclase n=1 Tax=Actinoplanes sp. NPDC049265 TaxID=3363902 RepID=UPI0037145977
MTELVAPRVSVPAVLARARDHLLARQDPAGWWRGLLETNVTMDAEDLLLREIVGIRQPDDTAATATWIRSRQRPDGTWSTFHDGPPDLSASVEAYLALRLAGDPPDASHLTRAASQIRAAGGLPGTRLTTRCWLAMLGLWNWDALPAPPPELILLPRWAPFSVYRWASWTRQTVVPLAVIAAHRPIHRLPFDLRELGVGRPHPVRHKLTLAGRHPTRPLRRLALRRCESWILDRQEADGSWGGTRPATCYSILALPGGHPARERALNGLDRFTVRSAEGRWVEACQSPVRDTTLAVIALTDAGVPGDHPAVVAAANWILAEEVRRTGDWARRRPHGRAGGWSFQFDNDLFPDTDDTAHAVLALLRARTTGNARRVDAAVRRGCEWLIAMQSTDGGWGAFDADNTSRLPRTLPFADAGAVTDPPSADVTAHVVEALCHGGAGGTTAVRRGVDWLLRAQEEDGSWFGRWGVNHVYGTGAVLPALAAARAHVDGDRGDRITDAVDGGVAWLTACQQPDGGWGEDPRSYRDRSWVGRGPATASQTAWGLLALLAGTAPPGTASPGTALPGTALPGTALPHTAPLGAAPSGIAPGGTALPRTAPGGTGPAEAMGRAAEWLAAHQRPGGGWDEPHHTGTAVPGHLYVNHHLHRVVFPICALARYAARRPGAA